MGIFNAICECESLGKKYGPRQFIGYKDRHDTYLQVDWKLAIVVVNNACPATNCARGVPITRTMFSIIDRGDAQYRVLALVLVPVLLCRWWPCVLMLRVRGCRCGGVGGQTAKNKTGCVRRRGGTGGGVRRRMPPRARARVSVPAIARSPRMLRTSRRRRS